MFRISLRAPLAALALSLAAVPAFAADAAAPVSFTESSAQGCWSFEDGSGATYFTLLRSGGRAIGFWTDTPSHLIDHGSWSVRAGQIEVKWNNGATDVLSAKGGEATKVSYAPGEDSRLASSSGENRVQRVDERKVGALCSSTVENETKSSPARAPTEAELALTRSPLVGYWRIKQRDGEFLLSLRRDGSVRSVLRNRPGREGSIPESGSWTLSKGEAVINWGRKNDFDKITPLRSGFRFTEHRRSPDEPPNTTRDAVKADVTEARSFFETDVSEVTPVERLGGVFVSKSRDGALFFIELARFGEAIRHTEVAEGKKEITKGTWSNLSDGGVLIVWIDGTQNTLRRNQNQLFECAEFAPGQPISGTPVFLSGVRPVTPEILKLHFSKPSAP